MKLHRYVDHQSLHIVTKDVISLSISVLLLFRHYISHKITFGAPSSGGVLCSACGAFINSCQIVQWDPQNVKRSSPQKNFGMGYVKMHGFHGNLLYDSRGWGVGLQIQSYLGFNLS